MDLHLNILPDNMFVWEKHITYDNAVINSDCGLDIPMSKSIIVPKNSKAFTVDLGFKADQNYGYMLIPRSSIAKTPLRLANSVGIIDKKYRGKVMAKVDNNSDSDYELCFNTCYFQIIAFNGKLPTFSITTYINNTTRGEGGFGSTTTI